MFTYRKFYSYVFIPGSYKHIHISLIYWLRGPRSKPTPTAMNTPALRYWFLIPYGNGKISNSRIRVNIMQDEPKASYSVRK